MSTRQVTRRDPETGAARKYWMIDINYEHPDGQIERVRKVSPVQSRRGAEQHERSIRQALVDGTYGKKEKQPTWPSVPRRRPWYSAPIACAASSITKSLCFLASAMTASMSAAWPKRWTGMIAFVRGVIASLNAPGSMV